MRAIATAAIWLCLLCLPAAGQDILMRASVLPQGPVMLGQKVALSIDVLFPGEMPHPPQIGLPRVTGAQVFRFETQATNLSERIDGTPYIGQRFTFDLYARRVGTLFIPPVQITLLNASDDPIGTRSTQAWTLLALAAPGLDPAAPIVASTAVSLDEQWKPKGTLFHIGDAITRLVTRSAADVPGLALPALEFSAPPGIRVYVDAPVIADATERGDITGRRTDRVTYILEQGGRFTLPGLTQPWWDLERGRARTLTLPALAVSVSAAPVPRQRPWLAMGIGLAGVLALTAVALASRRRIAAGWSVWQTARRTSEDRAFKALRSVTQTTDASATYRAWQRWNAVRKQDVTPPDLVAAVASLQRALFSSGETWGASDAHQLLQAVQAARHQATRIAAKRALPSLNPLI